VSEEFEMKGRNHNDPMERVEQRMALLGHELDNVLNGLLGMSRLLRESGLNAEQERWSRAIEHSGRQLRRLVSGFRSGRGLAERQPVPRVQPVDGIDLLEQVVLSHAPSALANGNRLLLTVTPEVPPAWACDPCLLRQVLDNLLGNAIKFSAGGEVLLHVAASSRRPGWLRFTVSDSGPGIDPAVGNRIFEAGVRSAPVSGGRIEGSGLGLFICRRAVATLGGTLAWSSARGGGARFEVLLPNVLAGLVAGAHNSLAEGPLRSSRFLHSMSCHLALSDPLLESVAGWLERLGVPWHDAATADRPADPASLAIAVSEHSTAVGQPGPILLLEPLNDGRNPAGVRAVPAPILCCTLGPALLGMALEWLWLRDDRPGSTP
jgi:hypothetical protein